MDLGDGMSYHPVDLRSLDPTLPETAVWGQLRIDKDGILQTADVIDLAGENPDLDAVTEGMFGPGSTVTAEGVQKIALFNTILGRAGAMLNEAILNGIADVRKQSGEPLPYSILHTELRSVEALHLMEGTGGGLVYTTGARVLVYADGWVLPGYVRAYLWKVGTSWRAILLWANDSQKDAAQAAGDRLVRRLVTER